MKALKKISILVFIISVSNVFFGQQEVQYTQFMVNPFLYNPALSGCEDYTDIKSGYRNQWTGLDGAPRTFYLSAHGPISSHLMQHSRNDHEDKRHSIGGMIGSDQAGDIQFNSAYLSYSYTITLYKGSFFGFNNHKRGVELALGTSVGAKQYKLDMSRIQAQAPNEAIFSDAANNNRLLPDAAFGAWLYFGDYTFVGLSAQQLFGNKLYVSNPESKLFQHYNFVAGSEFEIDQSFKILPSVLLKKVSGAPMSIDLNTRLDFEEKYFGGLSYRIGDAMSFLLGTIIDKRFEVAYSYDHSISKMRAFNSGSHEIILGMRIYPHLKSRNAEQNWR